MAVIYEIPKDIGQDTISLSNPSTHDCPTCTCLISVVGVVGTGVCACTSPIALGVRDRLIICHYYI